jgi:hypothetical protein
MVTPSFAILKLQETYETGQNKNGGDDVESRPIHLQLSFVWLLKTSRPN